MRLIRAKYRIYVMVLIAISLVALIIIGCEPDDRVSEYLVEESEFLFQPQSSMNIELIRQSLTPTADIPPKPLLKPNASPVTWTQQQFLDLIASFAPDEVKTEVQVELVFFAVACHNVDSGPQAMSARFNRIGKYQGQPARLRTSIWVDAQAGYVSKSLTAFVPQHPPDMHVDDISAKLPAERILISAEQNGGRQYRESRSNQCIVRGMLTTNEWSITYETESDDLSTTLFLNFDATTGSLIKTKMPTVTITPIPTPQ
jgi:hypothetical protein